MVKEKIMGSTIKEMFEKMSPEQQRLQNIQGLIATLVFGRFVGDGCGVSRGDQFSEEYLKAYDDYKSGKSKANGIYGYGFGFYEDEQKRLDDAGFLPGKKIAATVKNESHKGSEKLPQEEVDSYGQIMVEHFSALGVRCMAIQGGNYPDKTDGVAVLFDVNDPDFLNKIKPDFLNVFPAYEAKQLESNHPYNNEESQQYAHQVVKLLADYAKENNFDLEIDAQGAAEETPENVLSMAEHKLDMFKGGLEAMFPVLSMEERKAIMIDILDRFVSRAPNNKEFNHIRRLALV